MGKIVDKIIFWLACLGILIGSIFGFLLIIFLFILRLTPYILCALMAAALLQYFDIWVIW